MPPSNLPPGWSGPYQSPNTAAPYTQPGGIGQPTWVYAGFWWRVWAFLIDALILSVVDSVLGFFMLPDLKVEWQETPIPDASGQTVDVVDIADFVQPDTISVLIPHIHAGNWHLPSLFLALLPALYFIIFESSSFRATPGKRLCRLEVTTSRGRRLSIGRAALRFAVKAFISFPFFYIGVLMVAFTRHKQGLHDLIADTVVIRAETAEVVTFEPRS
ncbi:hypothetical protein HK13_14405 [Acetobacter indonesiensis]|uniref:RDD family protein n=1 Tax=Acetobacter indonesiensis TaxID=104101 RepID=UPI000A35D76D|nr:RDD family protein [Acetobacter indonesiensis]OUI96184.1 hypothetical protein HK13_14405 [Acetobacter indonesiensis]